MDAKSDLHRVADPLNDNARDLEQELDWLAAVLDARLKAYFGSAEADPLAVSPPPLDESRSPWAEFVRRHELTPAARLVVLLALVPHVRPQLLDVLWVRNEASQRGFTEFGGVTSHGHGGFVPTGETALFLLAGSDLAARFRATRLFEGDHLLALHGVVHLGATTGSGDPALSGPLQISSEYRLRFTTGLEHRPAFGADFPARLIATERGFGDLVLSSSTLDQLEELKRWVLHGDALLDEWGMRPRIQAGFTCLFHGPPGTGKTLSACLLGKHCNRDVYKVDLSMVVSKYIGDTEKNLARIFELAENKRWILFFDEADALFGKRTRVDDARDRFANQEISFLLQRIEEFAGVVILASNFRSNIDEAFARRFHCIVQFSMPRVSERHRLWKSAFSSRAELEPRIDLARIADRHEMSGGAIMNVVRYASLHALNRGHTTIFLDDIEEGIRREFTKEGRVAMS
jgi:hypothetical protein